MYRPLPWAGAPTGRQIRGSLTCWASGRPTPPPRAAGRVPADGAERNQHLFHDAGAFQVGLGLALWLSAIGRTGLSALLPAVLAASLLHLASHVEDRALGGQASDLAVLGVPCVLLAIAWALERRAGTPAPAMDARAVQQAER